MWGNRPPQLLEQQDAALFDILLYAMVNLVPHTGHSARTILLPLVHSLWYLIELPLCDRI